MRSAFIDELVKLANSNPSIVLIVGDLGYSVIEPFAESYPDRFINAGVAEQNMASLAAGMASEGYHVFIYSIANFPTFRCAEQIRNDIDYHQLPVTIVSVGGGVAYGALGYSHHAVQDFALMRSMPNMLIAAPGDPMETRACLRYLVAHPQPSYLRLGKAGDPVFHDVIPSIIPGEWLKVRNHGNCREHAYLGTGGGLRVAMAQYKLQSILNIDVYSLPLWGMKHKPAQSAQSERYSTVTTFEDHLTDGGFGSWLLEATNGSPGYPSRIRLSTLHERVCGTTGTQQALSEWGGLINPS